MGESRPSSSVDRRLLVDGFPGGYWRYDIVDHVLLVNIYFPPAEFYRDLSERLPSLINCYPSPHPGLAQQVAGLIGQDPLSIAVGNGVAELIAASIQANNWRVVVPTPSFNPYETSVAPERLARFPLPEPSFELDVDAFAVHAIKHEADCAIVISPNNPTSRSVARSDLIRLVRTLASKSIRLIVDESFIEFSVGGANATLENEIERYPNLIIFKSLGKIFGVCGLRLGYILSADHALIASVRHRLPAWNVNTLAEFFLRSLPHYHDQAQESWALVKRDRDQLFSALSDIPNMDVLSPDANFVFCRLPEDWPDGDVLADRLLSRYQTLIRHSGAKTMRHGVRYLRVATRSIPENVLLVDRLREVAEDHV